MLDRYINFMLYGIYIEEQCTRDMFQIIKPSGASQRTFLQRNQRDKT